MSHIEVGALIAVAVAAVYNPPQRPLVALGPASPTLVTTVCKGGGWVAGWGVAQPTERRSKGIS